MWRVRYTSSSSRPLKISMSITCQPAARERGSISGLTRGGDPWRWTSAVQRRPHQRPCREGAPTPLRAAPAHPRVCDVLVLFELLLDHGAHVSQADQLLQHHHLVDEGHASADLRNRTQARDIRGMARQDPWQTPGLEHCFNNPAAHLVVKRAALAPEKPLAPSRRRSLGCQLGRHGTAHAVCNAFAQAARRGELRGRWSRVRSQSELFVGTCSTPKYRFLPLGNPRRPRSAGQSLGNRQEAGQAALLDPSSALVWCTVVAHVCLQHVERLLRRPQAFDLAAAR